MDCCQCQLIEEHFDREGAASKARQYQEKGLNKETKILVDALVEAGVEGSSLLDVGGGVGALGFELIKRGISKATNVEASSAYVEAAITESSRQALEDKITHIHGNFVDLAPAIPPADIVTLDKVICCYDDMVSLVESSVAKATRLYGLIYPRDTWWVKAAIGIENLYQRRKGSRFRVIVHPSRDVDRIVTENDMQRLFYRSLIDWQIVVYGRRDASGAT